MRNRILSILFITFLFISAPIAAAPYTFTVVIDPGHGGKDPGTLGSMVKEKDIVLSTGLRLGELIRERHPDVRVLYTRSSDVFIPLDQRAILANKAKANLFISIHADHAETPGVKGASTFTLGLNRSRENFEIAKRENSVILLEDNYKQRYEGFDPNSAESYIMFEFMQDNYMNQSIQFASTLQSKFVAIGRYNRGVRQDVFLVLRCTSMPSVLVELGFLSNREEEEFLNSEKGRNRMAESLLRGFTDFKNNYERKSTGNKSSVKRIPATVITKENESDTDQQTKSDTSKEIKVRDKEDKNITVNDNIVLADSDLSDTGIQFKIQMLTSTFALSQNDKKLKGIPMDCYVENKLHKYTYGKYAKFEDANRKRRELSKTFPDAFVIAFKNNQKIPVETARAQTNIK